MLPYRANKSAIVTETKGNKMTYYSLILHSLMTQNNVTSYLTKITNKLVNTKYMLTLFDMTES